jgi:hypothetical protein
MYKQTVLVLALIVATYTTTCPFIANQLPLINEEAKLLQEVENGQKFLIGDINDPLKNYLYIANLKGTPN